MTNKSLLEHFRRVGRIDDSPPTKRRYSSVDDETKNVIPDEQQHQDSPNSDPQQRQELSHKRSKILPNLTLETFQESFTNNAILSSNDLLMPSFARGETSPPASTTFHWMSPQFLVGLRGLLDSSTSSFSSTTNDHEERENHNNETSLIEWCSMGKCFVVRNKPLFAATVATQHLGVTSYSQFQMVLEQTWGFVIVPAQQQQQQQQGGQQTTTTQQNNDIYYHPWFQQKDPAMTQDVSPYYMRLAAKGAVGSCGIPELALDKTVPKIEAMCESKSRAANAVMASLHNPTARTCSGSEEHDDAGTSPISSVKSIVWNSNPSLFALENQMVRTLTLDLLRKASPNPLQWTQESTV